jgi:GxxExxY protein
VEVNQVLLIEGNKVLFELKSVENVLPVHKKQLLTYLRVSDVKLGLLINFNVELVKNGITRIVNNLKPLRPCAFARE